MGTSNPYKNHQRDEYPR